MCQHTTGRIVRRIDDDGLGLAVDLIFYFPPIDPVGGKLKRYPNRNTTIGDDAHTGSNSVLVAPITVGEGATIGAGSTVTRSVPPGKLTVARAKQLTLDGWKRPSKVRKP